MLAAAAAALLLVAALVATPAGPRTRSSFDGDWRFQRGVVVPDTPSSNSTGCSSGLPCDPTFDASGWRKLTVPHDYVLESPVSQQNKGNGGSFFSQNVSWYRKAFELPRSAEGRLIWLTLDGVFRAADIYINGALIKHHEEGYTSWTAYLHNASSPLRFGVGQTNVVAVFVDSTQPELWCYEGGGIFRHTWLETAGQLSVVPHGFYAPTLVNGAITGGDATKEQTTDAAILLPRLDLQNVGAANVSVTVSFSLWTRPTDALDTATLVVSRSRSLTVPSRGFRRVATGPIVFGVDVAPGLSLVKLWNTALEPPLYTAKAQVRASSGEVLDAVETSIGVRSAVFDARLGFLLNGVKVRMQGTANHLGFGGVGIAVPDRVQEFQIANLRKSINTNAWRTAHNPVSPEFLDYADQYGLLVWEENRFVTHGVQPMGEPEDEDERRRNLREPRYDGRSYEAYDTANTTEEADPRLLQDAQDMVLRDRNHPSIVLWSLW